LEADEEEGQIATGGGKAQQDQERIPGLRAGSDKPTPYERARGNSGKYKISTRARLCPLSQARRMGGVAGGKHSSPQWQNTGRKCRQRGKESTSANGRAKQSGKIALRTGSTGKGSGHRKGETKGERSIIQGLTDIKPRRGV